MLWAAVLHELVPQSLQDSLENRERPTAFEDSLGRLIVCRFTLVAVFAEPKFERLDCPAPTFLRSIAICFVGHKKFQRSQKKRPKASFFPIGTVDISAFEHTNEEFL